MNYSRPSVLGFLARGGFLVGLFIFLLLPIAKPANAQVQFIIARTLTIGDKDAVNGDIVTLDIKTGSLVRTKVVSDPLMYGVLASDSMMVYRTLPTLPVTRQGDVFVNVTTLNGPITIGDFVTGSPIAGKGQKAEGVAGYMLGVALGNFDGKNATDSATYQDKKYPMGKVKVTVGIGPASPVLTKAAGGILGTLKQLATAIMFNISTSKQAERIIRYILAVLIAIVIIYVSYRTFGRNITKGIEAIGRNPLAKGSIQAMIMLNVILLIVSIIAGVILSLVIISL
ncbi:hypothetical protein A2Z00_05585 [Candidatus Gottesmanbacteria bacterium RBG_13_45_10]|uniref:Uncharacterized protein n=1 Tax=Candidatus Gottesmanbacteria bacterium RBG_13_45_10 TaxID=1798370 RepID=A0A1F5ZH33_9BACT|nr:MAG: hypothetical protein A2Z00_05585 [Candidatus Gottesmanbacteria bacterium RBG_13_45_10]